MRDRAPHRLQGGPGGAAPARSILRLKTGRVRAHPWIYRDDIAWLDGPTTVNVAVTVVDHAGGFVGRGFYNPRTSLACRILTRADEPIDGAFFSARIAAAVAYREGLEIANDARRLVWSEADGLPGVVVDRYGDLLVLQCLTAAMDAARPLVADALRAAVGNLPIYLLDDPG